MTSGSANAPSSARPPTFLTEKVIGASHVRTGKPCQDEAGSLVVGEVVVVAVADGHGSSRFADAGARLAVQVALTALVRFAEELGHRGASIGEVQKFASHPLRVQIVREWAERVRANAGTSNAALIDYGSTLLFAVATSEFLLVGQLGDGDVLLVGADRQVSVVIPADPRAFADETPSLCLPEAWHSLRVRVVPAPQEESLLLLSTDGYSKSYASDDVFRQIGPDYLDLVREGGTHGLAPHLRGFLEQVTTQGSGDDIAVAMLYWPPHVAETVSSTVTPEATEAPPESGHAPQLDDGEGLKAVDPREASRVEVGEAAGPDAASDAADVATESATAESSVEAAPTVEDLQPPPPPEVVDPELGARSDSATEIQKIGDGRTSDAAPFDGLQAATAATVFPSGDDDGPKSESRRESVEPGTPLVSKPPLGADPVEQSSTHSEKTDERVPEDG
jgi:Protein phosphatase 2C